MIGEDSSCHTGIPSSQGHKVFGSKVPCADCEPVGVKSSRQQVRVRERTSVIIFQKVRQGLGAGPLPPSQTMSDFWPDLFLMTTPNIGLLVGMAYVTAWELENLKT